MKDTPDIVADTILDSEIKLPDNIEVKKLSMARYALMELVESPFIVTDKKFTVDSLLDTFFIMTCDKSELKGINSKNLDVLHDKAIEFAEELDPKVTSLLIDAIAEKMGLIKDTAPQGGSESGKSQED